MTTIVWFRQDLRLADNPALAEAARRGPVLPVYVLEAEGPKRPGAASRWWLHHSLAALKKNLPGLLLLRGDPAALLPDLAERTGAEAIFWNRCYEPAAVKRDTALKAMLAEKSLDVCSFNASLLFEPWELQTKNGGPFKVFSPFWRAALIRDFKVPVPAPKGLEVVATDGGLALEVLNLLPKSPDWARDWRNHWNPGEAGACVRLQEFLGAGMKGYGPGRDRPDKDHVSRLSPHLHFGEISPRQVAAAARFAADSNSAFASDTGKFLSEVGWREFAYHLLYHFPDLPVQNWKPTFDAYPWADDPAALRAWQRGQTGYPMVDAGMRELWQTGYMHNRVRMIAASFLIKHLRIHWQHGADWFFDTLVDADLANNSAGWQWVAGSGADAAPYFRIFNPVSQGRKFDPNGDYVRRWIPELAELDTGLIHAPFEASELELQSARIELGNTYPRPIVDHAAARKAALAGYENVRAAGQLAS